MAKSLAKQRNKGKNPKNHRLIGKTTITTWTAPSDDNHRVCACKIEREWVNEWKRVRAWPGEKLCHGCTRGSIHHYLAWYSVSRRIIDRFHGAWFVCGLCFQNYCWWLAAAAAASVRCMCGARLIYLINLYYTARIKFLLILCCLLAGNSPVFCELLIPYSNCPIFGDRKMACAMWHEIRLEWKNSFEWALPT